MLLKYIKIKDSKVFTHDDPSVTESLSIKKMNVYIRYRGEEISFKTLVNYDDNSVNDGDLNDVLTDMVNRPDEFIDIIEIHDGPINGDIYKLYVDSISSYISRYSRHRAKYRVRKPSYIHTNTKTINKLRFSDDNDITDEFPSFGFII